MRRLIRWVANIYPRSWRERYGDEFAALLEDVRPSARTALNVFTGAIMMQIRTWGFGRMVAIAAVVGCAVFAAVFFLVPKPYRAEATLRLDSPQGLQKLDAVNKLAEQVESRRSLTGIITAEELYSSERKRQTLEDVIEKMRRDIRVSPVGGPLIAIKVAFADPDPHVAQRVTQRLISSFMAENVREPSGVNLQVLEPAALPTAPVVKARIIAPTAGILSGIVALGALLLWRRRQRA